MNAMSTFDVKAELFEQLARMARRWEAPIACNSLIYWRKVNEVWTC